MKTKEEYFTISIFFIGIGVGVIIEILFILFMVAFDIGNIIENNGLMYSNNCLFVKENYNCYNQTTLIDEKIINVKTICEKLK